MNTTNALDAHVWVSVSAGIECKLCGDAFETDDGDVMDPEQVRARLARRASTVGWTNEADGPLCPKCSKSVGAA